MKKTALFLSAIAVIALSVPVTGASSETEQQVYTIADVKNLRDFLLTRPVEEDLTGKQYDLDHDGVWSGIDLCLMKREYIKTHPVRNYRIEIAFDFTRGSTHATSQVAAWIQNEDGEIVKTIYVSDFTGVRRGYRQREDAVSHWVAAANPESMSDEKIDAVSSATFKSGAQKLVWDFTDDNGYIVADGIYTLKLEGTLYWTSNVVYTAKIDLTELSEGNLDFTEIRSEPDTSENANMIENVSIALKELEKDE